MVALLTEFWRDPYAEITRRRSEVGRAAAG
jgi:hypothetical protein